MKETIFQALYIMRICLIVAVVVSVGAFLFDTEPPQEDKPNFIENGNSGECIKIIVQVTDEIEKTDDFIMQQSEDSEAVPPFDFDVNVITKTKGNVLLESLSVYQTMPHNATAFALEELEKRKGYFISICKRCCCRRKYNILI